MGGYESDDDKLEQDIIITTASDTSSGDGKVVATSIDGEDDVVDVTVTGPNRLHESVEADVVSQTDSNPRKRKFRSGRPKWVNPDNFLPAEFNDIFELSYFGNNKEVIPSGWSVVDEEKRFPRLSTRLPVVHEAVEVDDDEQTNGFAPNFNQRSDGESSEDDISDTPQLAPTRMNEESSDEDDLAPNTRVCL
jgi:ubiquitin carboxyl-terminal hydrolase 4/11/15